MSSFSVFLQLTALAPKTGKTSQKREIFAFPAFFFNNTYTTYHKLAKHSEYLLFVLFFGYNAIDCKNELWWGVVCAFGNMHITCTVSQHNREMCENGVFGGISHFFFKHSQNKYIMFTNSCICSKHGFF